MRKKLNTWRLFGFPLRNLFAAGTALLIAAAVLWIDFRREGSAYDLLWQISGETTPLEQLRGGLQYLANSTRQQPQLAHEAPISPVPDNRFGVNAFLELEAIPEKRTMSMKLIADAGFGWLRQQFAWEDVEISAKGDFTDARNDRNGDSSVNDKDRISSWEKYDQIVKLAQEYNVNILARLSGPTPRWALAPETTNTHSPPVDLQDFVDYAVTVAKRYKGQITHYQIWNEPNLYPEWGDQLISPEGYTEMLCRTYTALKAIDSNIVILTGALGPTIDLSGRDAYDLLFLQRMYDLGAGACFDILSAQGYGLFSGPPDQRLRPYTVNFGRHQWLRDVMVANGDAHKPIWLSEAAWNPVPDDPTILARETYGVVTEDQAATWAALAYERARKEWEWIGVINWWFLKRPSDTELNQPWYYFRLVEHNWKLTPVYRSLRVYMQSGALPDDTASTPAARELLPQVLVLGMAILFAGYIAGDALWIRFLSDKGES